MPKVCEKQKRLQKVPKECALRTDYHEKFVQHLRLTSWRLVLLTTRSLIASSAKNLSLWRNSGGHEKVKRTGWKVRLIPFYTTGLACQEQLKTKFSNQRDKISRLPVASSFLAADAISEQIVHNTKNWSPQKFLKVQPYDWPTSKVRTGHVFKMAEY